MLSQASIKSYYEGLKEAGYAGVAQNLLSYKKEHQLDDWLYYQLIRTVAGAISPKAANYHKYTLFKWFLLVQSGYNATVSFYNDKLLLYVQSDEEVFEVPYHIKQNKQYVCLNYHDYGEIDFKKEIFKEAEIEKGPSLSAFTYKITRLPEFKPENYAVKELQFDYGQQDYHFKILVNDQVKKIFANYPVVDYAYYFNIPLSKTTYGSLIPLLKENIKGMNQANGVDYLMRFTRYAFAFETDTKVFGKEKRLSPEQTLLYENSDCEDRAAFFFYLVKELYDLPMIVLSYPEHITIAVQFSKPVGHPIHYKGNEYSICEATPQRQDLKLGQSIPHLKKVPFDVVYEYQPKK
ncbi:MAG: hypothetical protein LH478_06495 [Chitinophagaceae bacterium]|nr:hypothetical protein [Chitinophagaceae bacterium]